MLLSIGSYLKSLFTIEGAAAGSLAASLPLIVTAIALGVILAGVLYTLWRGMEASFLGKLLSSNALAEESGKTLTELGYTHNSFVARRLRSPLCFLYKTVSCKARDAHIADMQARMQNGEDGEKTPKTTAPLGFLVDEDTTFYILPDRLTYAKSKGGTFTIDDYMSLVYTSLLCIGIWFALLNVLDPLVAFLGG